MSPPESIRVPALRRRAAELRGLGNALAGSAVEQQSPDGVEGDKLESIVLFGWGRGHDAIEGLDDLVLAGGGQHEIAGVEDGVGHDVNNCIPGGHE